jgi:hypothetical protein
MVKRVEGEIRFYNLWQYLLSLSLSLVLLSVSHLTQILAAFKIHSKVHSHAFHILEVMSVGARSTADTSEIWESKFAALRSKYQALFEV